MNSLRAEIYNSEADFSTKYGSYAEKYDCINSIGDMPYHIWITFVICFFTFILSISFYLRWNHIEN